MRETQNVHYRMTKTVSDFLDYTSDNSLMKFEEAYVEIVGNNKSLYADWVFVYPNWVVLVWADKQEDDWTVYNRDMVEKISGDNTFGG